MNENEPAGGSESPLNMSQDSVMADYQSSRALQTKGGQEALHLFFSPWRVPVGLIDEEIAVCVWIYQQREVQQRMLRQRNEKARGNGPDRNQAAEDELPYEDDPEVLALRKLRSFMKEFGLHGNRVMGPAPLPDEFRPDWVMTRERFQLGLYKLLAQFGGNS